MWQKGRSERFKVWERLGLILLAQRWMGPGTSVLQPCQGRKIILYLSSSGWTNNHINMRQISRRKTNQNLITYIPPVTMGETQEHWVTRQNNGSHHLQYHLRLKTKMLVMESQLWEVNRKSTVNKGKVIMQVSVQGLLHWQWTQAWYSEGNTLTDSS